MGDTDMPKEPLPWRSAVELKRFVASLGVRVVNPTLPEGGLKLFGKSPRYPESLDDAKERFVVRIETYIEQSTFTQQNFIVVTHADAICAALHLFGRGNVTIEDIGYCARLSASRLNPHKKGRDPVYADQWRVQIKGVA